MSKLHSLQHTVGLHVKVKSINADTTGRTNAMLVIRPFLRSGTRTQELSSVESQNLLICVSGVN